MARNVSVSMEDNGARLPVPANGEGTVAWVRPDVLPGVAGIAQYRLHTRHSQPLFLV